MSSYEHNPADEEDYEEPSTPKPNYQQQQQSNSGSTGGGGRTEDMSSRFDDLARRESELAAREASLNAKAEHIRKVRFFFLSSFTTLSRFFSSLLLFHE